MHAAFWGELDAEVVARVDVVNNAAFRALPLIERRRLLDGKPPSCASVAALFSSPPGSPTRTPLAQGSPRKAAEATGEKPDAGFVSPVLVAPVALKAPVSEAAAPAEAAAPTARPVRPVASSGPASERAARAEAVAPTTVPAAPVALPDRSDVDTSIMEFFFAHIQQQEPAKSATAFESLVSGLSACRGLLLVVFP